MADPHGDLWINNEIQDRAVIQASAIKGPVAKGKHHRESKTVGIHCPEPSLYLNKNHHFQGVQTKTGLEEIGTWSAIRRKRPPHSPAQVMALEENH